MLDITGRLGDGWLPSLLPPDQFGERLQRIRETASAAGRDGARITAGMWFLVVVDEDHETAHRLAADRLAKGFLLTLPEEAFARHGVSHPLGEGAYGLREYIPTMWRKDDMLAVLDAIPDEVTHEYILHGTPDDIVQTVREYEARGLQHVVLWNISFLGDLGKIRSSYSLMDDVLRALKAPAEERTPA
jgi:phthiodiolone/phenolphthiodiolone dimycocerosates ketoreductase